MGQHMEEKVCAELQMKNDIIVKHYIKTMAFIFGTTSKKSASHVSPVSFDYIYEY